MNPQDDSPFIQTLTYDIRHIVYELIAREEDHRANVTMAPPRKRGRRAMRLQNLFPKLVEDFQGTLNACQLLQQEVGEYLAQCRHILFYSTHSAGLHDMPEVFGRDNCLLIRRFELRMEFRMKTAHQYEWPGFLQLLLTDVPNLEWFKLYSEWFTSQDQRPYPQNESGDPAGTLSRFDQERRAKLRFLAWLIHYAPNLDLLIRPANTGPTWAAGEHTRSHYLIAEKYDKDKRRTWETTTKFTGPAAQDDECDREMARFEDQVFDTTLVRRLQWHQYADLNEEKYFIKPEPGVSKDSITTSTLR